MGVRVWARGTMYDRYITQRTYGTGAPEHNINRHWDSTMYGTSQRQRSKSGEKAVRQASMHTGMPAAGTRAGSRQQAESRCRCRMQAEARRLINLFGVVETNSI